MIQPIVCSSDNRPDWAILVFCKLETFTTLIFIFPTLNSLANAVVLSRSSNVKEEIRKIAGRIRVLRCMGGE